VRAAREIEEVPMARVTVDDFFCKGCGICAKVCPFGAISMREGK